MRTPDGRECAFYYTDYFRGREVEECRVGKSDLSADWKPQYCAKCPVPEILRANASPYLKMQLTIKQTLLGFGRKMDIRAWCDRHDILIKDPYIGCPKCNEERPGLKLFAQALEQDDNDD